MYHLCNVKGTAIIVQQAVIRSGLLTSRYTELEIFMAGVAGLAPVTNATAKHISLAVLFANNITTRAVTSNDMLRLMFLPCLQVDMLDDEDDVRQVISFVSSNASEAAAAGQPRSAASFRPRCVEGKAGVWGRHRKEESWTVGEDDLLCSQKGWQASRCDSVMTLL